MELVLASALAGIVAALITTFVTWQIAAKRFVVENIDRERMKWRKEVREIAGLCPRRYG